MVNEKQQKENAAKLAKEVAEKLGDGWVVDYSEGYRYGTLRKDGCDFFMFVRDLGDYNVSHADKSKYEAFAAYPHVQEVITAAERLKIKLPVTFVTKVRGLNALVSAIQKKIVPVARQEMTKVLAQIEVNKLRSEREKSIEKDLVDFVGKLKEKAGLQPDHYEKNSFYVFGIHGAYSVNISAEGVVLNLNGTISADKAKRILQILAE